MDSEIKILITSDLHLGMQSQDPGIPSRIRLNTFKKIATLALEHDILFIAGDLMDAEVIEDEILEQIKTEFDNLRNSGIDIFYTPGISEMVGRDVNEKILPLNATAIFTEYGDKPHIYEKEGNRLYIYGTPPSKRNDISKLVKTSDDGFHIGLFYADFDIEGTPESNNIFKIPKNMIKSLSLDFYALGYSHSFRMFKILNRIIGAYPGSPEPVSINETGDRYAISVSIKDNEIFHIKRLSVNSVKVNEIILNCTEYSSCDEIIEAVKQDQSKKIIEVVTLIGTRDFPLQLEKIRNLEKNFFDLRINDKSAASIKSFINEFIEENSIRGEFYKILSERIRDRVTEGVDMGNVAAIINKIENGDNDSLEDWLCGL
jgi:DNA repair exonuclease SbcCD nuclease subunit